MRLRIDTHHGRLLLLAMIVSGAASLAAACGNSDGPYGKTQVVTTLPLFADMIREIGGDRVNVSTLYPARTDPHTYELSPRDVQKITEADGVIVNGMGLETPALRLIERNLKPNATLVKLAEAAAAAGAQLIAGEEENPHLWLDVRNARYYARIIRDVLAEADPVNAQQYETNYQRFQAQLDELDRYVRDKISAVPPQRRKLVTSHDAFPYLARYLGFEVIAVAVPRPGQEPSPQDLADLEAAIRQEGVPAVFTEPQLGAEGRLLEKAASDAGVRACTLYSDSLDDRVRSYIELMRFNADEIARCLGGAGG